jgi:hypothetical protein
MNPFQSDDYLIETVENTKKFYLEDCMARNDALAKILQMEKPLQALRAERNKPWLAPENRLICAIKETPGCRE